MRIPVFVVGIATAIMAMNACASRAVQPAAGPSASASLSTIGPPALSSSPTEASDPPRPGAQVIVLTADMLGPLTIALHDVIDVELVSTNHGPQGVRVPWRTPTSSDPAVLQGRRWV